MYSKPTPEIPIVIHTYDGSFYGFYDGLYFYTIKGELIVEVENWEYIEEGMYEACMGSWEEKECS